MRKSKDPLAIDKVKHHIKHTWPQLTRSHQHLLEALDDPKLPDAHNQKKIIYISRNEAIEKIQDTLKKALPITTYKQIKIQMIPSNGKIKWHGLLYLPHPYVVPGGRFNEMYGWDSFFIILGLLKDGEYELAKSIVNNALYQVEHYGNVLNSNRSYHLDRTQPPLLSQMVLAVYKHQADDLWLKKTIPILEKMHSVWMSPPHYIETLGLSRYYANSNKPAIEVVYSELDDLGTNHYQRVREYYRTHIVQDYEVNKFYDYKRDQLKSSFYQSDRTARESGFDPSNKYGPFGAGIIHYASVCLNTLLYQMEIDMAEICGVFNQEESCKTWLNRAQNRKFSINAYCFNQDLGYYFDYHIDKHSTRSYIFATTFYPLWAGVATEEYAQRVYNNLATLETPGGLMASAYVTGNQWDGPFGWAPFHYFAIKGLARYGYKSAAKRLAKKFISLVSREYLRTGLIYEKYDVSKKTADVKNEIRFGYQANEIGFGWTNGVFLELLDYL